jgi:hypothetical protein
VEPATTDRIQRMIDAEATERFPPDAVPQLMLLRYGDHPVIEPGELYLLVILGQDAAARAFLTGLAVPHGSRGGTHPFLI